MFFPPYGRMVVPSPIWLGSMKLGVLSLPCRVKEFTTSLYREAGIMLFVRQSICAST